MRLRSVAIPLTIATLFATAGCTDYAEYDERMEYLRTVAQRGADTHALIASQEGVIDKARCERAFGGLDDREQPMVDNDVATEGNEMEAWEGQIKEFFVDSCVSGKPKPVPGNPAAAPSTTPPLPAPSGATSR